MKFFFLNKVKKTKSNIFNTLFLLCFFYIISPSFVSSAETGWLIDPYVSHVKVNLQAEKISEDYAQLLININLDDEWKTYWRSPGSSGIPLSFEWINSDINEKIFWPIPKGFEVSDIYAQGYMGSISFPVEIYGKIGNKITGILTLPTCYDICVITTYPFELSFDYELPEPEKFKYEFQRLKGNSPIDSGLFDSNFVTSTLGENEIQFIIKGLHNWENPIIFLDTIEGAAFDKPNIFIEENQLTATFPIEFSFPEIKDELENQMVSFVVADQNIAQQGFSLIQKFQPAEKETPFIFDYSILIYAFIGGLVLNIMPCVFPVLGMNLAEVLNVDKQEKSFLRKRFFASAFGILTSFWIIAAMITVFKSIGKSISWGMQFQNPWFLGIMAIVIFLFSLNFFGAFSLYLPNRFQNYITKKIQNNLFGSFIQGMFSTLLATPCSAPFLVSAISVAFMSSIPYLWLILTFVGLGLSFPWIFVAIVPQIARLIPKSGNWLNTFKFLLGILMLISTLWILSLLMIHFDPRIILAIAVLICLISLKVIADLFSKKYVIFATILLGLLLSFEVYQKRFILFNIEKHNFLAEKIHWKPLSEKAIKDALAQNKSIFVNVTANWCVTCKVNEINIFSDPEIKNYLNKENIVALKGDWSKQDQEITDFLKARNRFAVPFYQIYRPDLPNGKILSTLLSKKEITDNIK